MAAAQFNKGTATEDEREESSVRFRNYVSVLSVAIATDRRCGGWDRHIMEKTDKTTLVKKIRDVQHHRGGGRGRGGTT